jgi:ABC-2 type transport system permease protein
MKNFWLLLRHEIHLLFVAAPTYIAASLFLLLMGFIYWINLRSFTLTSEYELPNTLFYKTFWLPVFFLVPLLTMRSLAEERRQGTLETLLTTSAGSISIVAAKYAAAYLFYMILWALTLAFPLITQSVVPSAAIEGNLLDRASLTGGISFIALSGCLFIAVGIFSSSLTRSQLVAGMLSFAILFVFIVGGFLLLNVPLSEQSWMTWMAEPLEYLQTFNHLEEFSRGIIDTRPFFYYLSTAFLFLGLAVFNVESKA